MKIFQDIGLHVVSFFMLSVCIIVPVHAQEFADTATHREVAVEEVVVTAARINVPFSKTLRSVGLSTSGDLRLSVHGETSSVMELLPGVDVRQRGAPGQQADISIRGGTFDQTLVLIDGVNVSDPQTGHHNMDLPFDISAIERIEVLKGPGARIFGPNAFNGVVNIILREPSENRVSARITAGSHDYTSTGVTASVKTDSMSDLLAFSNTSSDGYIYNTDFKNVSLFNRFSFSSGKMGMELQTGYFVRSFGANSFYSPRYPDQYETTKSVFVSLKTSLSENIKPLFYWRRHLDCFELFRYDAPEWYTGPNYHMTDVMGSDFNYTLQEGEGVSTSLGYSVRYERIISNKLGNPLDEDIVIKGVDGTVYSLGDTRFNAGVMAEQSFSGRRWSFSGGLLVNFSTASEKRFTLYPGFDAGWLIGRNTTLYTSLNRTLRSPTFTDLYYNDPVSIGNPDLHPEEAWVAETGVKYSKGALKSEASLFCRFGRNMIDWVRPNDSEKWQVTNLTHVNIYGFELSAEYDFRQNGSSFFYLLRAGYACLYADKSSSGYQSKYLLDILRNKLDLSLTHKVYGKFSANWCFSWQDRDGGFIMYNGGVADTEETPFSDLLLLDGRVNYRYEDLLVFLSITNITDSQHYDIGNVKLPGRWVKAGIIIDGKW